MKGNMENKRTDTELLDFLDKVYWKIHGEGVIVDSFSMGGKLVPIRKAINMLIDYDAGRKITVRKEDAVS